MTDFLEREQIQQIVDSLSADDLIESGLGSKDVEPLKALRSAFDRAAQRYEGLIGGAPATQRVRVSDFQWWAKQLGGSINIDSPLSQGTEDLLHSAATGE